MTFDLVASSSRPRAARSSSPAGVPHPRAGDARQGRSTPSGPDAARRSPRCVAALLAIAVAVGRRRHGADRRSTACCGRSRSRIFFDGHLRASRAGADLAARRLATCASTTSSSASSTRCCCSPAPGMMMLAHATDLVIAASSASRRCRSRLRAHRLAGGAVAAQRRGGDQVLPDRRVRHGVPRSTASALALRRHRARLSSPASRSRRARRRRRRPLFLIGVVLRARRRSSSRWRRCRSTCGRPTPTKARPRRSPAFMAAGVKAAAFGGADARAASAASARRARVRRAGWAPICRLHRGRSP